MSKTTFTQSRRVTALVDQILEFTVDTNRVKEVMDDSGQGLSKEDAIGYLLSNGECEFVSDISTVIDEVTMTHNSEIIVD